jgi:predicted RNA binding protein YcfA (HicA-like mRNA interferase family)
MADCAELLEAARANPSGVRFRDLLTLAECHGWIFARQSGSHAIYKRPGERQLMTFQERNGMAKAYQVRQLIEAIDSLGGEEP